MEIDVISNKEKFISILSSLNRNNARISELIEKMVSLDFFTAPASSIYHLNCEGGLCQHSLNVYKNLLLISESKQLNLDKDSMIITALLHDISKMGFYEKSFSNKKIYSDKGSKYDELGRYDWVSVPGYRKKDDRDLFLFGNHESTSEFITRCYIPLTVDESIAILHHMGGMAMDSAKDNISAIYEKCPLALALHLADMEATYFDESVYE